MIELRTLAQISPDVASSWANVPVAGLLIVALGLVTLAFIREWVVPGFRLKAKEAECEQWKQELQSERSMRQQSDEKYVALLQANVGEWKERDRTIELLTQAATGGKIGGEGR